ncbi:hypothetical protein [Kitasatospora acidiphila]|nr:hypothetical protein [Kitasatospora acidiphila]
MDDCPATALILFHDDLCRVICNRPAGHDGQHEDLVLGMWGDSIAADRQG